MISQMDLQGLMFDLDGTLVEFILDHQKIRQRVIEILRKYIPETEGLLSESYPLIMLNKGLYYLKSQKNWKNYKIIALKEKIHSEIEKIERKAAINAKSIDGMKEVLSYAKKNNIKTGIITLNSSKNAIISLEAANLANYFPNPLFIIGRDKTEEIKPHSAHPKTLLKKMKLKPSQVILIGDHPSDIKAANHLEIKSIAIVDSKYSPERYETSYYVYKSNISPFLLEMVQQIQKRS
jgi:phosphoglycolate phosphatase-like HAD superfamily hydrolase